MRIKYNRVSTIQQTGNRFLIDTEKYDRTFFDTVSGSVGFHDRPQAKELVKLVDAGKVSEITVEELSRLGRNTGNVISVLEWLDEKRINVVVRNLGLQSRPNGGRNPVWKMITSVMSSLYEMELENIKERTTVGRMVYVQKGGKLGRPAKSVESEAAFLKKPKSKDIIRLLKQGLTIRKVSKLTDSSTRTVMKVKGLLEKED